MAVNVRINTTGAIGRATIKSPTRTAIAAQSFTPKPNVSLNEVADVSTTGVQDGYTLIYNSETGKFEAQAAADLTGTITQLTGGTF
jgi:hypothetical protein